MSFGGKKKNNGRREGKKQQSLYLVSKVLCQSVLQILDQRIHKRNRDRRKQPNKQQGQKAFSVSCDESLHDSTVHAGQIDTGNCSRHQTRCVSRHETSGPRPKARKQNWKDFAQLVSKFLVESNVLFLGGSSSDLTLLVELSFACRTTKKKPPQSSSSRGHHGKALQKLQSNAATHSQKGNQIWMSPQCCEFRVWFGKEPFFFENEEVLFGPRVFAGFCSMRTRT